MSLSASITISNDSASPAVSELLANTTPARLAQACRAPLRSFWRDRLKKFPRLAGKFAAFPATGFGEASARSVEAFAQSGGVLLQANQQGLRLRYQGGTIRPVNAKVLCFGITEETYGRSYAEMRSQLLARQVIEKNPETGKMQRRKRSDDEAKAEIQKQFAFAPSVTFRPNPAVVPTAAEFTSVAHAAILNALN